MPLKIERVEEDDVISQLHDIVSNYGVEALVTSLRELNIVSAPATSQNSADLHLRLDSALQHYRHHIQLTDLAKGTKNTYLGILARMPEFFIKQGITTFDEFVEPINMLQWIRWVCPPVNSNRTRNKYIAFTRSFIRTVLKGDLPHDLKEVLEFSRVKDDTPKAYRTNQVGEMLNIALTTGLRRNRYRNYTIIVVFIGSGIRVSELRMLKVKDINWREQTILISPKGNKSEKERRFIGIEALDVLKDYVEQVYGHPYFWDEPVAQECFVFPAPNSGGTRALTVRAIQKIIETIMPHCKTISDDERGILTVHSFRHYFALSQLENGVDIYTIAKLLGHKSVKTTEMYLKLFDEQLKSAINALSITRLSGRSLRLASKGDTHE